MPGPAAGALREETLLAGYLFFGEDDYQAEEFVGDLARVLSASAGGEFHLTRMDLDEAKWRDIIDTARTAPFLFEPWRALVVRVPERKAGSDRKAGADGEEGRGTKYLTATDQKILKEYFADPPPRTVIVVIRAGRVRRDDAMVRFFQSLPKTAISVAEMKRLPEYRLMQRADEKARSLGKTLTERAKSRLIDLLGQDLRLVMNEVAKLAVFVGDKKGIEESDVDLATAGQRSFQAYELDDALAAADFAKGAAILNDLFAEGETVGGHPRPPGRVPPQRPGRPDLAPGEEPDQGRDLPGAFSPDPKGLEPVQRQIPGFLRDGGRPLAGRAQRAPGQAPCSWTGRSRRRAPRTWARRSSSRRS